MNYHLLKALILAATITTYGLGQSASHAPNDSVVSTWKTAGMFNGRFWKTLNADQKAMFLFGYSNGVEAVTIATSTSFDNYKETNSRFWARALTVAEVQSALDTFYAVPENGPIALARAVYVISQRSEGKDEAELQKIVTDLRARATKN
jgi:hypothetical protein